MLVRGCQKLKCRVTIVALSLAWALAPHGPAIAEDADVPNVLVKDGLTITYAGQGGNCDTCEWISLDGRISASTPETFLEFLRKHDFMNIPMNIYLHSNGGSLHAGLELGRIFRRMRHITHVGITRAATGQDWADNDAGKAFQEIGPGKCISACAYAFLGGTRREAEDGQVGVHRFFDPRSVQTPNEPIFSADDLGEQQKLSASVLEYVTEMGVAPEFVVTADRTPSDTYYYLTKEEMRRLKVVYDPATLTDWGLQQKSGGLVMSSKSGDGKKELSIFCEAGNKARLEARYTALTSEDIKNFKETFASVKDPFELLSIEIKKGATRLKSGSDFAVLSAPLSEPQIAKLRTEKGDGEFEVSNPHALQGVFLIEMHSTGFGSNLSLAMKNCLQSQATR
jgi:hypothetical protein